VIPVLYNFVLIKIMIVVEVVENKPAPCTVGTVLIFNKRARTAYSKLVFASVFCLITEEKTVCLAE
jgi:hypothetical protein